MIKECDQGAGAAYIALCGEVASGREEFVLSGGWREKPVQCYKEHSATFCWAQNKDGLIGMKSSRQVWDSKTFKEHILPRELWKVLCFPCLLRGFWLRKVPSKLKKDGSLGNFDPQTLWGIGDMLTFF